MAKKKFYVVWNGVHPGIYDRWEDCKLQTLGYPDAKFKSYDTHEAAREAYEAGYVAGRPKAAENRLPRRDVLSAGAFIRNSLAVDAACSGNPGDMEYRGVHVATGQEWFHAGPYRRGTNNIGEFLALVHGLALMKRERMELPLYSDSMTAIAWVRKKECKTQLERTAENEPVFDLIERAEKWLRENTYPTVILKWDTEAWGEIPADFG
ncbi:MAG: ribonuclease H family protein, partial [Tannerella sp.]|nr:ribonuclease H family protein [Tannerella sp.]